MIYFSATIFSQSSSNTSQPFKTTVVTTTVPNADNDSTSGQRRISRRISAKDGVSILEKFRKPTLEDISPSGTA